VFFVNDNHHFCYVLVSLTALETLYIPVDVLTVAYNTVVISE